MDDSRNLAGLIADLQRQRRDLEATLDDRQRSREETGKIVDKIVELRKKSEELMARARK